MKAVILSVVGLLCLANGALGQCPAPTFTEQVTPGTCGSSPYIKLPSYTSNTEYYDCSFKSPVLATCGAGTYFCYVLQGCVPCSQYIPPVQCSDLTIGVKCSPISDVTVAPPTTTKAPVTTTTAAPGDATTKTTTVKTTTVKTTTVAPGSSTTSSGDLPGTTMDMPGPPAPNEGPTPPGPDPTVPNLPSGPPVVD